ncbi:MAG: PKD domain-containing protein [Solirubrobacteraceae bacterium]|nr:PKD domain-containing protein [Solirubrobacteraceae bacterium]
MNLLRPAVLFWVCVLALLGAATAGAQTPLEASFEFTPAEPAVNELVTLTDTTKNPAGAKLEYAWDLDADDVFDDGNSMAVTTAFTTPGDHRVTLRVKRVGTAVVTDSVARTIHVREGATATPTATPVPTVIHAPKIKLPPVARIDQQCGPLGTTQLCFGPIVALDKPKTFDASPSTDDHQIVRYEWDVDGNGVFEADTGANPKYTVTLKDERPATLRLRVTDDDGLTGETTMALTKLEPECQDWMREGRIVATGPCLRRYSLDNGVQYRSAFPITVNGVTIVPRNGKRVLLNVLGSGLLRRFEIIAGDAVATLPFQDGAVELQKGALHWVARNGRLENVASLDGKLLNGLRITGAPDYLELPAKGASRTSFYVKMPDAFGAPTSEKPIVVTQRSTERKIAGAASAEDAFSFTVPNASIGPIGLDKLLVSYDGEGLWEIEANVQVPVLDAYVEAKAGIYKGDFNYAGAEVGFGSPGAGPFGPVYLQRIKFRVEVSPKKSECVPHLGVEKQVVGTLVFETDYGVPTYALCGEVGLTGGPKVLGASLISLDAGLGLATYDDRPSVFRAFGNVKVATIPFADATFEAHTDGFLKVAGNVHYGWDGFASIRGYLELGVLGKKFNAEGGVKGCLDFVDWCRGVKALVSSKGIAVCMVIDYGIDDWRPGFGYKWGDSLPTPYFSGCSLGPYREHLNRARAAALEERVVKVPAGLPGTAFVATGAGAPPKITLVGPKGERISTPEDLMPVEAKPFLLMKNPQANITQVAVLRPSAGDWKVIVEDGSVPVTSLKVAGAIAKPKIDVQVSGKGASRKLTYAVTKDPSQTVSFIERGPSTAGTIGAAGKLAGALTFTPAGGAGEKREIVAIVEQDGMVTDQLVVGHYRAPKVFRPGLVKGVKTSRRGTRLAVSWKAAAGAERYVVTLTLSDGRRVVRQVANRSLTLRTTARAKRVSVRAVTADGMLGR